MELIPASFIHQLPDILTLGHTYLAEGWCFWLLHITPYTLDGILPIEYYDHLMDLIVITQRAISYDLTEEEVLTTFQDKCINWVTNYKWYVKHLLHPQFRITCSLLFILTSRLYYQYKEE